jgi:hypothetical protein
VVEFSQTSVECMHDELTLDEIEANGNLARERGARSTLPSDETPRARHRECRFDVWTAACEIDSRKKAVLIS